MLPQLLTFNRLYSANNFMGDLGAEQVYQLFPSDSYVYFSAPHSVKTFRNRKIKKCDLYTGAIVRLLQYNYHFGAVIRNKFTEEKNSITDFIVGSKLTGRYFIDVHGMKEERDFELAVGVAEADPKSYEAELAEITRLCQTFGLRCRINHPDYTGRFGLTGDLQKITGRTAVLQLEWRRDMRDIVRNPDKVTGCTIPFMAALAHFIEKNIRK